MSINTLFKGDDDDDDDDNSVVINLLFDIHTYRLTKKETSYMGNDVPLARIFIRDKT